VANRVAYARKFRELTPLLAQHVTVSMPEAAFYWWFSIPARFENDDELFTREVYAATGVTVVPGSYLSRVGPDGVNPGRGYVRIALVSEFDECREAVIRLARFLSQEVVVA
jgi:N-succinyldiaminopimelate aminotransferase